MGRGGVGGGGFLLEIDLEEAPQTPKEHGLILASSTGHSR